MSINFDDWESEEETPKKKLCVICQSEIVEGDSINRKGNYHYYCWNNYLYI